MATTRKALHPALWRRLFGLALAGWGLAAGAQQPDASACPPVAQQLSNAQIEAGTRDARDRGFLWRIARDGRVSYLYGTLHIARPPWMFPGPQTLRALNASDTLALELDMLDADIQRRMALGMKADPSQVLAEPLAERLRAQVVAACLSPQAMAAWAPEVQLAALMTLAGRWDGLDPAYAIDSFLGGYGRALGKTVLSLETPELQLALLKGDPQTAQAALSRGLEPFEQARARPMLLRIADVWAQGRIDELARFEQWCDCANTEADRAALKRLLDERNGPLAERIEALHAAGKRVFAAVGALHMVGPTGLPALLAQRGFAVQRIDLPR